MVCPLDLSWPQSYTVHVSHLEIYNEELTDLLEEEPDILEVRASSDFNEFVCRSERVVPMFPNCYARIGCRFRVG